jgi:hypothetical protein
MVVTSTLLGLEGALAQNKFCWIYTCRHELPYYLAMEQRQGYGAARGQTILYE